LHSSRLGTGRKAARGDARPTGVGETAQQHHPTGIGEVAGADIQEFLSMLAVEERVSVATQKQAIKLVEG